MHTLKKLYTISTFILFTTINAQFKKENATTILATFEIRDARDNGEDITPQVLDENSYLILYKEAGTHDIMLSNYWERSASQSYGSIHAIAKKTNVTPEKKYSTELITFNWSYTNTYNDKKGIAESKIFIVYKPQGVYFQITIIPEDLKPLIYKGELKGSLGILDAYIENKL